MSDQRWREPGDPPEGNSIARELDLALGEARDRVPDDVTLRRMWARVANVEPSLPFEMDELGELSTAGDVSVADLVRVRATRPPRWIWFAGGVASTAALAVAFVAWLWPRHELAPAVQVAVAARPAPPVVAEPRVVPAAEGTIRTGAGERLQLTLADGAEARLESSSVMTIDRGGRAQVDGGEVAFKVPHQSTGHSYVVLAGPYRFVVLGTRFKLRLDDAHRVHVDAQEGDVDVWGLDKTDEADRVAHVAPGESWSSPAAPEAEAAAHEPARTRAHARTVALASPGTPNPSAAEGEAAAQAALSAGDPSHALALYRALAQRGGPAGENAAYQIGKILRDRLGQPASAVTAWRRYRAEHPNGLLRVETDVSIIETLVHAGDTAAALAEANDFIRNHPDSERRAEIARVAGDLYRARADYRRAAAAYQIALASPLVRDAAEPATFHRAECLIRLGDPSGAEAARGYLRRWPSGRFRAEAERLLESGDGLEAARL